MTITATPIPLPVLPGFRVKDCPPSGMRDEITRWADGDGSLNVAPGELVVHCHTGHVAFIAEVFLTDAGRTVWVRYEGDLSGYGGLSTYVLDADSWVAVKRYTTGVAEAEYGSEKEAPVAA
jgi:hypothetical protein